jgi:hypothetical protein
MGSKVGGFVEWLYATKRFVEPRLGVALHKRLALQCHSKLRPLLAVSGQALGTMPYTNSRKLLIYMVFSYFLWPDL